MNFFPFYRNIDERGGVCRMGFWGFIDENFAPLITLVGTIAGAIVGGLLTFVIQRNTLNKQIEWDKEKVRQTQKEKVLGIYSDILEVNGTKRITKYVDENYSDIDIAKYGKHVRSILFGSLHHLHSDVARQVNKIDEVIASHEPEGNPEERDFYELAEEYLHLIYLIEKYVDDYRVKFLSEC